MGHLESGLLPGLLLMCHLEYGLFLGLPLMGHLEYGLLPSFLYLQSIAHLKFNVFGQFVAKRILCSRNHLSHDHCVVTNLL